MSDVKYQARIKSGLLQYAGDHYDQIADDIEPHLMGKYTNYEDLAKCALKAYT